MRYSRIKVKRWFWLFLLWTIDLGSFLSKNKKGMACSFDFNRKSVCACILLQQWWEFCTKTKFIKWVQFGKEILTRSSLTQLSIIYQRWSLYDAVIMLIQLYNLQMIIVTFHICFSPRTFSSNCLMQLPMTS